MIKTYLEFINEEHSNIEYYNVRLFDAVKDKSIEDINEWLLKGANINCRNVFESTPLIESCSFGSKVEIVKCLINNGADLNLQNQFGHTALIVSSMANQYETLKLLIESGAKLDIKNNAYKMFMDYYNCKELKTLEFQDWLCSLDKINFLLIPKKILHPEIEKKYRSLSNADDLGLF